ncbi:unnamed protein product [Brassica rapa]|uniref:Uncharacterized protein n=2 Tax=Brassica TaxID=3705 RepID=A0A3P6BKM1_BRACM|nr:unnamed protein product [Brassica napus]CAG7901480.1 unnamed protein product [Brassica rapa]VDC96881.1 unnamed protein product [Brassica rapa]
MGNTVIRARREARFYKIIAIDYVYTFLRKICRENSDILMFLVKALLFEKLFFVCLIKYILLLLTRSVDYR